MCVVYTSYLGLESVLISEMSPPPRLVSYEMLNSDPLKVIISSQALYFFTDSPPDPHSLEQKTSLKYLLECRPAVGKTSEYSIYSHKWCDV